MPNFFERRRSELGLTQRQIAEAFDPPLTPATVSAWENDVAAPQLDGQTLARVYQCPVMDVLTGVDQIRRSRRAALAG